MNIKKTYLNAPAPLFAKLLDAKERDIGFSDIICVAVAKMNMSKGYSLSQCSDVLTDNSIPSDAIQRGQELLKKYEGIVPFGIERTKLYDFRNNYKSDEEIILLLAYLAIKSIVGAKPFAHITMARLLSRMSGFNNETEQIHPKIAHYAKKRDRKRLKDLLEVYYKVSFNNETRGFFASVTLTKAELAAKLGKEQPFCTKSVENPTGHTTDYQAIIAEKDEEIKSLRDRIEELEKLLSGSKKKPAARKSVFSKEINNLAKNTFVDFYKHICSNEYYWQAKDSGSMTGLLKMLKNSRETKGMTCTDQELVTELKNLLNSISDTWILGHLSVGVIASKYNEIIANTRYVGKQRNSICKNNLGDNRGAFDKEDSSGFDTY